MAHILLIGAGGVASVCAHKMAGLKSVFSKITLASRTQEKCDAIIKSIRTRIKTPPSLQSFQLNADSASQTRALIEKTKPDLVVHCALPYQDLAIMDACLATHTSYLDTANYEPPNEAKFEYRWQWDYHDRFRKANIMALLGSGFDPGVTNVFTAWAQKHEFDEIETLDILDCNAGDHKQPFATNFNPEINIREVTAPCRHFVEGKWIETKALSTKQVFDFPTIGKKDIYLMYHEELESLTKHFPSVKRARFWMTFSPSYLTHLEVLQNINMTSIKPIPYQGKQIVPLQFLKAILPNPTSLAAHTKGKTCIGNIITGKKNGIPKTIYIYNICDHEICFRELGSQAVSYTTGVPAMIGAALMVQSVWKKAGVFNIEQMDPDPFMDMLNQHGLSWQVKTHPKLDF